MANSMVPLAEAAAVGGVGGPEDGAARGHGEAQRDGEEVEDGAHRPLKRARTATPTAAGADEAARELAQQGGEGW